MNKGRANRVFLLLSVIGVFAMPATTRAQPSSTPSATGAPAASPQSAPVPTDPNQFTLYRTQFQQAIDHCHQLVLEQIQEKEIDAQTQRQNGDLACGSDQTCKDKAMAKYTATMSDLQKQRNTADGTYQKELAQLAFQFNSCAMLSGKESCPPDMAKMFAKPVAQWSCAELADMLNPNSP